MAAMPGTPVAVLVADADYPPAGLELLGALAEPRLADSANSLVRALDGAEVLFAWDFRSALLRGAWPHAGALRWIHTGSVGVDAVVSAEVAASDVVVTNTRGVFERPIAEYVLGLLLLFVKDLPRTIALQRRREWRHRETEMLGGRRALILGAGAIARELARLLHAVGIAVDAVGRTARDGDPDFGHVHPASDVDLLLPSADFVILALPLTAETHGFFGADRLARMKPGARIVNVGRGALIDEEALLAALESGRLAGAALDVFASEPLPDEHPFWAMEQVVVSPHMAGDRIGWQQAAVEMFAANLRRWRAGEPLAHVVDKHRFRLAGGSSTAAGTEPR
jgi:phosphoglycerate dehydrogenase-like enzyme